jgi:peroxiredoxin Q/BCP
MTTIALGKTIPKFSLPSTSGGAWKSTDCKGKFLVVYFYPRDNTPGCTTETAAFRDHYSKFKKAGAEVVGISSDSLESHLKFKSKLGLPFELLSDSTHEVCKLFEVFKEKSLYGKKFMGIERSTFLIDGAGKLRYEWRKVKVLGHVEAVLTELLKL